MRKLSDIAVHAPQDFEEALGVRVLLGQLPAVGAPVDFVESLDLRVHGLQKPLLRRWAWLVVAAVFLGVGVWYANTHPAVVEVTSVPSIGFQLSYADLENLDPVAVREDIRWTNAPVERKPRKRSLPPVVPGY